jgi:hypothetical protein
LKTEINNEHWIEDQPGEKQSKCQKEWNKVRDWPQPRAITGASGLARGVQ